MFVYAPDWRSFGPCCHVVRRKRPQRRRLFVHLLHRTVVGSCREEVASREFEGKQDNNASRLCCVQFSALPTLKAQDSSAAQTDTDLPSHQSGLIES